MLLIARRCATCRLWDPIPDASRPGELRMGYCRFPVQLPIWLVAGKRPIIGEEEGENCPTYTSDQPR